MFYIFGVLKQIVECDVEVACGHQCWKVKLAIANVQEGQEPVHCRGFLLHAEARHHVLPRSTCQPCERYMCQGQTIQAEEIKAAEAVAAGFLLLRLAWLT